MKVKKPGQMFRSQILEGVQGSRAFVAMAPRVVCLVELAV